MSAAARARPGKAVAPVQLGSAFDVTVDMAEAPPAPAKPAAPLGAHTFSATQPAAARAVRRAPAGAAGPLVGTNAPEVRQVDIVRARPAVASQPPVAMERLAPASVRSGTARSQHSPRPSIRPKMYVFSYREEAAYIPRPFISSHRPKAPREKPRSARADRAAGARFTFDRPAKLSKRREVVALDFCRSIAVGSFQQFEQSYRGP
jgi:hypothetical protein